MKNRKILTVLFLIMLFLNGYSQSVKIEIVDYLKNIDGVDYSTYQYANSSYSHSRPQIIFITSKENFMKLHQKISTFYNSKQEFTDVFILGLNKFNKKNISEIDKKIIDKFLENIIQFRAFYKLPLISNEEIYKSINYLEKHENLCNYLLCKNYFKKY